MTAIVFHSVVQKVIYLTVTKYFGLNSQGLCMTYITAILFQSVVREVINVTLTKYFGQSFDVQGFANLHRVSTI